MLGVPREVELKILNTKEGTITIEGKEYFVWCGTLYETYSKFGYCDEVEIYPLLKKNVGDYFIRLSLDTISIFYKNVNTLKSIDVSNMPWNVKETVFDYLSLTLLEKSKTVIT